MISSKKGNLVLDMIVFVIGITVFSMVIFFGWEAFSGMSTDITNDVDHQEAKDIITEVETRYPSTFDSLGVVLLLGLWVMGIVSALMSDQHPLMFGFFMIAVVFVLITMAFMANYFEETYQDAELDGITANFPMLNWIMTNLLTLGIAIVLTILLAYLGKTRAI